MRVRQIPNNREAIYLIKVGYLYKVGRTENFQARIAGGKGGYQVEGKGRLVGWYEIKLRDGERCEKEVFIEWHLAAILVPRLMLGN